MTDKIKLVAIRVSIKSLPNSEPCCLITTDISDRMYVELFDGNNPHTLGDFTLEELEANPTLKVEVKFKNFKWEDF